MWFLFIFSFLSTSLVWSRTIEIPLFGGESKILYPCSLLEKLDLEDEESYRVTFFEKNNRDLRDQGLILRQRDFNGETDLTLKYRSAGKMKVDEELYHKLSNYQGLKCEVDVTFDPSRPKIFNTCSLKSSDHSLQDDFLRMLNIPKIPMTNLRSVQVEARRWKLKLFGLKKKLSVEVWRLKNQCLLEISTKFKDTDESHQIFKTMLKEIPETPLLIQGNKADQVLDWSFTSDHPIRFTNAAM